MFGEIRSNETSAGTINRFDSSCCQSPLVEQRRAFDDETLQRSSEISATNQLASMK
jgi:hypothetical protein